MNNVPEYEVNWIERILDGDEQALSEIYMEFGAQVHGITLYILKNPELAEEATQDTFLKVWNNAYQWDRERSTLKTWICAIARFTAIDIVRREHRHFNNSEVDDEFAMNMDHFER